MTPFQFAVCIGTTIANCIVGGQAIKVCGIKLNLAKSLSFLSSEFVICMYVEPVAWSRDKRHHSRSAARKDMGIK